MSEVVGYRGRLIPVDLGALSLDQWIQQKLGTAVLEECYDSWLEAFEEELDGDYGYLYSEGQGKLYAVERESFDPEGFLESTAHADGSYSFALSYYNGGADFDEVAQGIFRD